MVETCPGPKPRDEIDALIRLAMVILKQHCDQSGLCAACGCTFPCSQAVLAEHNLAF